MSVGDRILLGRRWGENVVDMSDPIVFRCNLAGTNTSSRWLTLSNEGDAKVVLEASATELAAIMRLSLLGKRSLRVTVEAE